MILDCGCVEKDGSIIRMCPDAQALTSRIELPTQSSLLENLGVKELRAH